MSNQFFVVKVADKQNLLARLHKFFDLEVNLAVNVFYMP